jgi:hypothetical protein
MSVRAKFFCYKIEDASRYYGEPAKSVRFSAVVSDGEVNKEWSKFTPSGNMEMVITNPDAFDQFEQGKEYFLDISKAE